MKPQIVKLIAESLLKTINKDKIWVLEVNVKLKIHLSLIPQQIKCDLNLKPFYKNMFRCSLSFQKIFVYVKGKSLDKVRIQMHCKL